MAIVCARHHSPKRAANDGALTAEGFLIVVRRSAVIVLWPMFSFEFTFGRTLCSFVERAPC
jgi:hypothetical protein